MMLHKPSEIGQGFSPGIRGPHKYGALAPGLLSSSAQNRWAMSAHELTQLIVAVSAYVALWLKNPSDTVTVYIYVPGNVGSGLRAGYLPEHPGFAAPSATNKAITASRLKPTLRRRNSRNALSKGRQKQPPRPYSTKPAVADHRILRRRCDGDIARHRGVEKGRRHGDQATGAADIRRQRARQSHTARKATQRRQRGVQAVSPPPPAYSHPLHLEASRRKPARARRGCLDIPLSRRKRAIRTCCSAARTR